MFGNHSDIDKQIKIVLDGINQLTINIERLTTKHESLSQTQGELDKRVDRNETEIRRLENTNAKVETVSQLARWGGIALLGAVCSTWLNLSSRVDATTAKTETNALNITQLQSDSKDTNQQLTDLQKRVTENRETIIAEIRQGRKNHE